MCDHLCSYTRAVGRSENPGVPVLFGGHNLPPQVEIGLTDLPKSGGTMAPPAPPGTTPLYTSPSQPLHVYWNSTKLTLTWLYIFQSRKQFHLSCARFTSEMAIFTRAWQPCGIDISELKEGHVLFKKNLDLMNQFNVYF